MINHNRCDIICSLRLQCLLVLYLKGRGSHRKRPNNLLGIIFIGVPWHMFQRERDKDTKEITERKAGRTDIK